LLRGGFLGTMTSMNDPLTLVRHLARRAIEVDEAQVLFDEMNRAAMDAVGADRAFIALAHDGTGELVLVSTAGVGWTDEFRAMRLKIDEDGRGSKGPDGKIRGGITSHVAATGQPYITGDVNADPYYFAFFDDVYSEIAVPLLDGNGHTRGVINIESFQRDHFTNDHLCLIQSIADIAVLRLLSDGYRAREAALVEIGKDLSAIADTDQLMRRVVDVAAAQLRFEDCSLFVLDRDKQQLTLQAARGGLAKRIGTAIYPIGEGLTGWVALYGEPIRTVSPREDPRWQGRFEEFPSTDVGAFLAVPIFGRSGVLGVLRVLRRKSAAPWFRREFTEDDESVLLTIASQLGTAIDNSRILDRLVNTERMAAWGELSAKAAHMIGNRTFAIKGDLNELEYRLSEPEDKRAEYKTLAEAMRRGIFRLEEILQEFRDFVRATQISLAEYDLNTLIQQCVSESFPKRSPVTLTLDLTPGLPPILADGSRLKRAFSELVENALSFLPDGGALTIRTSLADSAAAHARADVSRRRSYLQIEFIDSGPGIPSDIKPRIFTPFFTSRARGLGLGLSIVKGIIDAHRGGIVETGEAGAGAHFIVFLPVKGE
jgi:signal transduction histidine kinase